MVDVEVPDDDEDIPAFVSAPMPAVDDAPSRRRRRRATTPEEGPDDESGHAHAPVDEPVAAPVGETVDHDAGIDPGDDATGDDATGDGEPQQLEIGLGPAAKASTWKLPPMKLLSKSSAQDVDEGAVEARGRLLEQALADHGVETRLVGMVVGPTVTRYELELGPGVKVARVTSLHKDIAYAMASPDVRILAPIPGRQAIGVEVPNEDRQVVAIGDILSSEEARRATHPLEVAVGRDINGRAVLANLATMPHVLIAGQTGAGKSSCINSLITSILMRSTPDQVRMVLVDPKRVELGQYNRLPHLLTQVVTNPKKAANALAWVVREMERRYDLLSEVGFRDITGYNSAFDRGELRSDPGDGGDGVVYERLPFILVVVDELADLMMVAARDVEESICRIAQMARAVGIHLVIATQRPSVNVITGVIKANIPARLAFAVSSLADSRVILDQPGAERLVGKGDMLLLGPSSSIAQRIQGCWVSEKEVHAVVAAWRRQAPEQAFDDDSVQGADDGPGSGFGSPSGSSGLGGGADDDDEVLVRQAMELVVRSQLGSTSMLQRKLRVGFARAGRVMDLLEERGVVGPSEGSKAREVLMGVEEYEAMQSGAWSTATDGGAAPAAPDDAPEADDHP
jgi:S-DNA-T family DNA segregation ATPase FtsK/SpoIIIE